MKTLIYIRIIKIIFIAHLLTNHSNLAKDFNDNISERHNNNLSFSNVISSKTASTQVKGTITLKVLLVEFKDVKHRNPKYPENLSLPAYTFDDFNNLLFSENQYISPNLYSPDGKEVFGSLRDYYSVMSNNNLNIEGYILNGDTNNDNIPDWICLDNAKSFYHQKRGNIFRKEAKQKAIEEKLDITTGDETFLAIIYAGHAYRKEFGTLNPEAFYEDHEYIMGERFASGFPYERERDDPSLSSVAHFAHIGIHAHELCHLLGFSDLLGGCDNKEFSLMSSGNFNGPNSEGACPAPINPYFRYKLGWIAIKTFDKSYTDNLHYDLSDPEVYKLNDNCSSSFFLVEYRKFNSEITLGNFLMNDYNSYVKNIAEMHGMLIWRKLTGDFAALLHSCGNDCEKREHYLFPGTTHTNLITPWSDNRESKPGYYWVPNTKPSNNCGLEIISAEPDNFIIDLYQHKPWLTSPSKPKSLENKTDYFVKIGWAQNQEPDFSRYRIYKRTELEDYELIDSTEHNIYADYAENVVNDTTNIEYVYYKITSVDNDKKESVFSKEIKIPVQCKRLTDLSDYESFGHELKLYQNYPNPFNPTTTIKYTVPNGEIRYIPSLQLIVYDILGQEVETLLNKRQSPGNYEVTWDARNHSDGIYFYTLQVGDFVQTKKMILLK